MFLVRLQLESASPRVTSVHGCFPLSWSLREQRASWTTSVAAPWQVIDTQIVSAQLTVTLATTLQPKYTSHADDLCCVAAHYFTAVFSSNFVNPSRNTVCGSRVRPNLSRSIHFINNLRSFATVSCTSIAYKNYPCYSYLFFKVIIYLNPFVKICDTSNLHKKYFTSLLVFFRIFGLVNSQLIYSSNSAKYISFG